MPLKLSDFARYLKSPAAAAALEPLRRRLVTRLPEAQSTLERIGAELRGEPTPRRQGSRLENRILDDLAEDRFGGALQPGIIVTRVLDAFAFASRGGALDRARVERLLGDEGLRLLVAAESAVRQQPALLEGPSPKLSHLAPLTRARSGRAAETAALRARMPALTASVEAAKGEGKSLEGAQLRAIQHLFPTTWAMVSALGEVGLRMEDVSLTGKKYSTDEATFDAGLAEGHSQLLRSIAAGEVLALPSGLSSRGEVSRTRVDPRSSSVEEWDPQGADESQAAYLERVATEHLRRLLEGRDPARPPPKRQLILDEGGLYLKALHKSFPEFAHWFVAVEQTEKGHRVVEELARKGELRCRVVSIARSELKKVFESAMIGESIADSIERQCAAAAIRLEPKVAALVGLGAVGLETARALQRRGFTILATDINPDLRAVAEAEGFQFGTKAEVLGEAGLVVGCTGAVPPPLGPEDWRLLRSGAVLANAASGNNELGNCAIPEEERPKPKGVADWSTLDDDVRLDFLGQPIVVGEHGDESNHHLVHRLEDGKELVFLRNGAVVNMTYDIPPEFIQLTRAALFEALMQALEGGEPDLVDLAPARQARVLEATRAHLASLGKQLERPEFSGLAPTRL